MTESRWSSMLVALSLVASAGAGAQTVGARTGSTDSLVAAVRQVAVGARVRLVMQGGGRTLADGPRVEGDSLLAKIDGHTLAFPLAGVDTLWVRNGTSAGRGALILGIPAALVGAILGANFVCEFSDRPCQPNAGTTLQGGLIGAAFLGVPAAVAGGVLGWTIIRWRRVYVRASP